MKLKIPKSLATCADRLYKIRADRLKLQKSVTALEEQESALREHIINNLPKSQATGIAGKVARATIDSKSVPQVEDWDRLYDYISKNRKKGAFALLQRRLSDAAVRELWDADKVVPGVKSFTVKTVSVVKR